MLLFRLPWSQASRTIFHVTLSLWHASPPTWPPARVRTDVDIADNLCYKITRAVSNFDDIIFFLLFEFNVLIIYVCLSVY